MGVCCVQSMNQHGIARMCRLLAVVQPALSSLGAAGAAFRPESARAFEKARAYYSLMTLPPDALIKAAAEKPKRFTPSEYMALLQVFVTSSAVYQNALPPAMIVEHWSIDLQRRGSNPLDCMSVRMDSGDHYNLRNCADWQMSAYCRLGNS